MKKLCCLLVFVLVTLSLSACSTMQLQRPQVSLVEFTPRPITGFEAIFDIKLKVLNPNAVALPLSGMTYEIALNGEPLFRGASADLPTIKAYGEEYIQVSVSTSLLSAPKIILNLANKSTRDIHYQFKSKLDLKGMLPGFTIVEEGVLPLR